MIGSTDIKSTLYFFPSAWLCSSLFFSVSEVNIGCKVGLWVSVLTFKVLDIKINSCLHNRYWIFL